MMSAELLTIGEAALRLKVNPQTLRRWIRQGLVPAFKIGRKEWRIREDDLERKDKIPSVFQLSKRAGAVSRLLELREELRGRKISLQRLITLNRRELEQRGASRRS